MTPALLAWALTDKRWQCARHLSLLNAALLDVAAGACKRLAVFMPPRHGKSLLASIYYPAWFLMAFPHRRVILGCYGNDFAASFGRRTRNAINDAHALGISAVQVDPTKASANEWEIAGHDGGLYAVGIGGGVTGRGADLLLLDDPVKSRAEAESPTYRQRTWDWYTDDVYTRLHPGAGIVLVQTRWHEDDLAGRILARDAEQHEWRTIVLPAFAEDEDELGRAPGEPLWPERYGTKQLMDTKATLGSYGFAALYQQRPTPREGGLFKRTWFDNATVDSVPEDIVNRIRYWDMAGTANGGDYTAGGRLAIDKANNIYIEHIARFQKGPHETKQSIMATASKDGRDVVQVVEQEPGSSGKAVVDDIKRSMPELAFLSDKPTGDKATRALPFAAACEAGRVKLVRNGWDIQALLDELCSFPEGVHDDQVDTLSGAYNKLTTARRRAMVF